MRKLFLFLALGVSLCVNAQLTVFEDGFVRIGNNTAKKGISWATLDISSVPTNQSATQTASGTITFGQGTGAYITGSSELGSLYLYGGKTISFGTNASFEVLSIKNLSNSITSSFPISAPSFLTSSDARLKTNVESLNKSYTKLQDVNSVSYNLSSRLSSDSSMTVAKSTAMDKTVVIDDRLHFGFIAQEIQKIYPNLVVEDEEGMLAIDYTGFIPLLVEAYKDLSNKVKEQEDIIASLSNSYGPRHMPASVTDIAEQKAILKQNKPNPFNSTTVIECTVPESAASSMICVYDLQGKQVHRIDIRERGEVSNVIDASYFTPGMYIYSLIIDGTEIDSKRMIITD
ncbi:MAG: tail fiber domain-containing protein [Muribaculaceae bacterium]|nr:tail fiber domain-containing protein [Muribaculaceae bacterium]